MSPHASVFARARSRGASWARALSIKEARRLIVAGQPGPDAAD